MLSVHTCPLAVLGGKETGGMNVYVRELSRELARRGHVVDVFTRNQNPEISTISRSLGPRTRVIHVTAGPPHPIPKDAIAEYLDQFVAEVLVYSNGRPYDVIYAHYWLSGLAGLHLRALWGVPLLQMFHTLGKMKNKIAATEAERASALRIAAETRLMREVDHIVAGSPMDERHMVEEYGAPANRITVIPPGVDVTHFYPRSRPKARATIGADPDTFLILFVGRIEPLKGVETLLRAVKVMSERCCRLEDMQVLIIGGDASVPPEQMDEEMARLMRLCAELGLDHLVTFLGKKGQDVLPDYYSAADVVVMPSHYESFGMVALEAMACGTPVVASRVGGLMFTVIDGVTGLHVRSGDPEELAGKLRLLMENPRLRRRLGEQAWHVAQQYAWPRIADRVEHLFAGLIRGWEAYEPAPTATEMAPSWA